MSASSLPLPLRTPLPQGASSQAQASNITTQNMYDKQLALNKSVTGGKKRHNRRNKRGGAVVTVSTITPRFTETMSGQQSQGNQQLTGLQTINQSQVQGAQDKVALEPNPNVKGGKKTRKSKKTRKTRKSKKTKGRKSRKSRK
jgi:hypothetical protein